MNQIYQAPEYGDNKNNLGCTANEVQAVATDVEGPQFCEIGSTVTVNVTASISFNADRYDVGLYTYTGSPDAYTDDSAVTGDKCAFQLLSDQCPLANENTTENGVYNTDGDECCDVVAQSGYTLDGFRFQDNLEVPCVSARDDTRLALQTCFTWRQGADGSDCPANASLPLYSWPGTSAKCECTFIFLNITVEVSFSC